jgi:hypothetical protein
VKHFRPYLYGRKFKIASDHTLLMWIMIIKDPGSRLLTWRIKLEQYGYKTVYMKGTLYTHLDALSRIHGLSLKSKTNLRVEIDEEEKRQILMIRAETTRH